MNEPKKKKTKSDPIDQVMDLLEELSEGMTLKARIRLYDGVACAIGDELDGDEEEEADGETEEPEDE